METFETSSNNLNSHRNTWSNYPPECYSASVDYYRSYGTARKLLSAVLTLSIIIYVSMFRFSFDLISSCITSLG